jgi:hypothetical protein
MGEVDLDRLPVAYGLVAGLGSLSREMILWLSL